MPNRAPSNLNILLVEDREADAFLTRELLEDSRYGGTVHVVPDGRRALEFLNRQGAHADAPEPDLVLLDLDLPDGHGRDVLRRIRALDAVHAPVIIVSGLGEGRIGEYLHAGAYDYVIKGSARRLCEAVDGALEVSARMKQLSPAQRRVLRLIAEGKSTQQIATQLGVSAKTVESHRAAVIKRLGLRDVASLTRFAVRVGLVPLADAAAEGHA